MHKYSLLKLILAFVLLLILNGCIKASLEDSGTIKYVKLGGGFYGIMSDNGEKLEPVNLKSEFIKDGLRVKFVYSIKKSGANIHQWGKIIEIMSIRKI